MGHPVAGFDQRRSAADVRIGKLHAVPRGAEVNLLLVTRLRLTGRGIRLIDCGSRSLWLRQRFNLFRGEPKDADRTGNVFYRLLPQIGKGERQLVPNLIVRRARDAYAAGLAEGFQAGGNIDSVPEDIVAVDNDVADIDPDAEHDAPVLGHARITADHAALNY